MATALNPRVSTVIVPNHTQLIMGIILRAKRSMIGPRAVQKWKMYSPAKGVTGGNQHIIKALGLKHSMTD